MCETSRHKHGHEPHEHVHHVHVRERVLDENEKAAARVRDRLRGTLMLNLLSSPGSGKTTLLEATVPLLRERHRIGALVGDVATERDANRLQRLGIPALQIVTGGACHLDARQIERALEYKAFRDLDILFVENVGNLVCPAAFDLGEDVKVALLSVTEGDDKPFKYPATFARSAVTLVTKSDLLPHVSFDLAAVRTQVASLNPDARTIVASAVRGEGMDEWCALLDERCAAKGPAVEVAEV
ncbi:MAG: hydrogenase nickel incorporation protein HypB [Planctomycetota bacterium]|jgi:hydrogenase nickel incorporation protein HypB